MDSPCSHSHSQQPQLPPGFRFHPTDEELIVHYLKRKASSAPLPVAIIADVDLYKFDPWELPSKATFGEHEWYFFSPRDRKYPNGARPNRAATSGYWKATGTDKPIMASDGRHRVGVKKALVFYGGKPPKGVKTNWIMHEYRLVDNSFSSKPSPPPNKNSLRLDDWVLCRIYKKNNAAQRTQLMDEHHHNNTFSMPNNTTTCSSYGPLVLGLDNDDNFFDGILPNHQPMQNDHHLLSSSKANNIPMKRTLLPSQFWNDTTPCAASPSVSSSSSKRFHCDLNNGIAPTTTAQDTTSFVSLLSQLPQPTTFHPNAILAPVGDGVLRQQFQLPTINWSL